MYYIKDPIKYYEAVKNPYVMARIQNFLGRMVYNPIKIFKGEDKVGMPMSTELNDVFQIIREQVFLQMLAYGVVIYSIVKHESLGYIPKIINIDHGKLCFYFDEDTLEYKSEFHLAHSTKDTPIYTHIIYQPYRARYNGAMGVSVGSSSRPSKNDVYHGQRGAGVINRKTILQPMIIMDTMQSLTGNQELIPGTPILEITKLFSRLNRLWEYNMVNEERKTRDNYFLKENLPHEILKPEIFTNFNRYKNSSRPINDDDMDYARFSQYRHDQLDTLYGSAHQTRLTRERELKRLLLEKSARKLNNLKYHTENKLGPLVDPIFKKVENSNPKHITETKESIRELSGLMFGTITATRGRTPAETAQIDANNSFNALKHYVDKLDDAMSIIYRRLYIHAYKKDVSKKNKDLKKVKESISKITLKTDFEGFVPHEVITKLIEMYKDDKQKIFEIFDVFYKLNLQQKIGLPTEQLDDETINKPTDENGEESSNDQKSGKKRKRDEKEKEEEEEGVSTPPPKKRKVVKEKEEEEKGELSGDKNNNLK